MKAEKFEEIWSGDNAEKTWTHRFLAKPKTIATGGLGVAESPPGPQGDALVKMSVRNPKTFFFSYKIR